MSVTHHPLKNARLMACGLLLGGLILAASPAAAESQAPVYGPPRAPVAAATAQPDDLTIRSLISAQLDAIRARDAGLAFALTTGAFHEKFDTATAFLSDMRFSYRPIYNHKSYRFLDQAETETGGLLQRVEITYAHGAPAVVIYRLQRNPEGAWAIGSFTILDSGEGQDI